MFRWSRLLKLKLSLHYSTGSLPWLVQYLERWTATTWWERLDDVDEGMKDLIATRLRAIFARDILLCYSYVQPYEALAQKLSWFSSCHHGVERRRPLPWAVVVVCPRPSTSPWPWHHGRRGDMLGQGHMTTTAIANWRWWYHIFSWLFSMVW